MQNPIAESSFDCVDRDGRQFVANVTIGDQHSIGDDPQSPDVGIYIEIDPIMERRHQGGVDTLSAVCCGIELVRRALKIFVAHGGSVYARNTTIPIDLDDFAFQPIYGLLRPEYLDGNPDPYRRNE